MRHQAEAPARARARRDAPVRRLDLLEADADEEALDERQDDRAVARVLRDLPPARLALLREPLEVRDDDREELQDDRAR